MRLFENTPLAGAGSAQYPALVRVGERIRAARLAKKMTQRKLAGEAHVSLRTIQKVEAGADPNMATARKLLEKLGVDFDAKLSEITEADRMRIAEFVDWLQKRFLTEVGSKSAAPVTTPRPQPAAPDDSGYEPLREDEKHRR